MAKVSYCKNYGPLLVSRTDAVGWAQRPVKVSNADANVITWPQDAAMTSRPQWRHFSTAGVHFAFVPDLAENSEMAYFFDKFKPVQLKLPSFIYPEPFVLQ